MQGGRWSRRVQTQARRITPIWKSLSDLDLRSRLIPCGQSYLTLAYRPDATSCPSACFASSSIPIPPYRPQSSSFRPSSAFSLQSSDCTPCYPGRDSSTCPSPTCSSLSHALHPMIILQTLFSIHLQHAFAHSRPSQPPSRSPSSPSRSSHSFSSLLYPANPTRPPSSIPYPRLSLSLSSSPDPLLEAVSQDA